MCPDASARLGWSVVCVGRCGTGYHFLGALFHGVVGSGDVVQHDPVGDSNTMELAAVLWALVWVVISCPPCSVCIATDSLFSSNFAEALWSVGGHAQLACLCSSMLLIARQITDVRFEHVKAHEGNPFNELADGLAKRAAGGVVAPLPDDVARLLVCNDSVPWEWLHGMPPETRGAYPPLRDGTWDFPEARSSVVPGSLVKHVANDVVSDHCSTDVIACVHSGSVYVCTLGDSGSRSTFPAGRPALIRRQVREIGINMLGVQEARAAAGSRVVDGYVVLASGADRGTLGCELWADTEKPFASVDGKDNFFRQSDFVAIHASPRVLVVRVTAKCLQCTAIVARAPHSGEKVAVRNSWWEDLSHRLAGQPDVALLVDANARLGSAVSAAVGSGGLCQQEDLEAQCSTGPWRRSVCASLPLSGLLMTRPSPGLPTGWCLTALIVLLCQAPGTVAPGSVVATRLPLERLATLPSLVLCTLSILRVTGRTTYLVALRAPLVIRWAPRGTQWRVEGVDCAALKDSACCSKFMSTLRATQPPPWAMSVDGRERFAAGAVCKAAFGAPAGHPRREHIDCAAWAFICDRRAVKTWCRERRVSAAAGTAPGRTPRPALGVHVGLRPGRLRVFGTLGLLRARCPCCPPC